MSKSVMTGTIGGGKLSREDAELILDLRDRAVLVLLRFYEIDAPPDLNKELYIILNAFIAQNTPPKPGPRDIAKEIDKHIKELIGRGMHLKEAIPYARLFQAKLLQKTLAQVKVAHLRYGNVSLKKHK